MGILNELKQALKEGARRSQYPHGIETHVMTAPEVPSYEEVLRKAQKELGYLPTAVSTRELQTVLHELEIDVLDGKQVKNYIAKKETSSHKFVWYKIGEYKLPIPVHVLNKALQIKERLPEAEFSIVNYEEVSTRAGAGDPFLFVAFNGPGYYVEVWDEPEFEARTQTK